LRRHLRQAELAGGHGHPVRGGSTAQLRHPADATAATKATATEVFLICLAGVPMLRAAVPLLLGAGALDRWAATGRWAARRMQAGLPAAP
jgi:hypothetical protein